MPKASTFQQWLFQMRTSRGFSQKDLEDRKSGIWQPRISEWENSEQHKKPSLKQLLVLFAALKATVRQQQEGRALWEALVLQDDALDTSATSNESEPLSDDSDPDPVAYEDAITDRIA